MFPSIIHNPCELTSSHILKHHNGMENVEGEWKLFTLYCVEINSCTPRIRILVSVLNALTSPDTHNLANICTRVEQVKRGKWQLVSFCSLNRIYLSVSSKSLFRSLTILSFSFHWNSSYTYFSSSISLSRLKQLLLLARLNFS